MLAPAQARVTMRAEVVDAEIAGEAEPKSVFDGQQKKWFRPLATQSGAVLRSRCGCGWVDIARFTLAWEALNRTPHRVRVFRGDSYARFAHLHAGIPKPKSARETSKQVSKTQEKQVTCENPALSPHRPAPLEPGQFDASARLASGDRVRRMPTRGNIHDTNCCYYYHDHDH